MIRTIEVRERPWGRDDLNYVREGRAGALFRGRDGLDVRLAAPERDVGVSRDRLSLVGVLIAFIASGVDSR
jgi:hypothetical protein